MSINTPDHSEDEFETQQPAEIPSEQPEEAPSEQPSEQPSVLAQIVKQFADGSKLEEIETRNSARPTVMAASDSLLTFVFETKSVAALLDDPNIAILLGKPETPAYLRDLARIAKIRNMEDPAGKLPEVTDEQFEDPYCLGTKFLQRIANIDRDKAVKHDIIKNIFRSPTPASPDEIKGTSDADLLATNITLGLFCNQKPSAKDFITFWGKHKRAIWNNLPPRAVTALLTFYGQKLSDKDKLEMSQDILRFVGKNGNHGELVSLWPAFGPQLFDLLKEEKHFAILINLLKSEDLESQAFAIHILSLLIIGDSSTIYKIAAMLFDAYADWKNQGLTDLFQLIETVPGVKAADKKELTKTILASCDQTLYRFITDQGYIDNDNLYEKLVETFPVFSLIDRITAMQIIGEKIMPGLPDSNYYSAISNFPYPEDFDPIKAALDIQAKTSLPLVERRFLVDKSLIPKRYVITIEPLPGHPKSIGTFRLQICYYTLSKKNKITTQCAKYDFNHGALVTKVPEGSEKQIKKLGIYLAHHYYVRKVVDAPIPAKPPQPPTDTENPPPSVEPPSEPPNPVDPHEYTEREAEPLKIDLRGVSKKHVTDVGKIEKKLSKTLSANSKRVKALLEGDLNAFDESIILHKKVTEVIDGRQTEVFIRVPSDEILAAAIEGTILDQPWFIIDGLPHMKTLGYHKSLHRIKKIAFDQATNAGIPQNAWEDIWRVNIGNELLGWRDKKFENLLTRLSEIPLTEAERSAVIDLWQQSHSSENPDVLWRVRQQTTTLRAVIAYDNYLKAGFPPLSDFRGLEALIYVLTNPEKTTDKVTLRLESPDDDSLQKGKVLLVASSVSQNVAATLTEKITVPTEFKDEFSRNLAELLIDSRNWLNEFIDAQERAYTSEIMEIEETIKDKELKAREQGIKELKQTVRELKAKIAGLPELRKKMKANTTMLPMCTPDGVREFARISLGWVPAETSFNSGHFTEIQNLLK